MTLLPSGPPFSRPTLDTSNRVEVLLGFRGGKSFEWKRFCSCNVRGSASSWTRNLSAVRLIMASEIQPTSLTYGRRQRAEFGFSITFGWIWVRIQILRLILSPVSLFCGRLKAKNFPVSGTTAALFLVIEVRSKLSLKYTAKMEVASFLISWL